MKQPECKRCGAVAEKYNAKSDSSFWGAVETTTRTVTTQTVRSLAVFFRRGENSGSLVRTDEQQPLCADCWRLLTMDFLSGAAIPAVKEGQS